MATGGWRSRLAFFRNHLLGPNAIGTSPSPTGTGKVGKPTSGPELPGDEPRERLDALSNELAEPRRARDTLNVMRLAARINELRDVLAETDKAKNVRQSLVKFGFRSCQDILVRDVAIRRKRAGARLSRENGSWNPVVHQSSRPN